MPRSAAADEPPASKKKTLDSDALQRPAAATSSPPASLSATGATLAEAREARQSRVEAKPRRSRGAEKPRSREAEEPYPQSRCCASPRRHQLCASLRCEQHACVCVCYVCDRRASASCALASTASLRLSCMCGHPNVEISGTMMAESKKVLLKSLRSP